MNKLTFTAYTDVKFQKKLSGVSAYSVMINPDSFQRKLSISYKKEQSTGSIASAGKFDKMNPESYTFNFIIDGTGIVRGKEADIVVKEDITININNFLKVVYNYIPDTHRSPFVEIEYCELIIRCILNSLDISYTLFHPDGRPLRAKVSCSFTSVMSPEIEAKKKDDQSPDITHRRIIKDGESLIAIANNIYENNFYYPDVAEKNNLNNFRKIKPGTAIFFPPLKN